VLYGPGRFNFADRVYSSWIIGNTLPDDGVTPEGHAEIITHDGLAAAYDRLNTWMRIHG
jgi:hypothetical protein